MFLTFWVTNNILSINANVFTNIGATHIWNSLTIFYIWPAFFFSDFSLESKGLLPTDLGLDRPRSTAKPFPIQICIRPSLPSLLHLEIVSNTHGDCSQELWSFSSCSAQWKKLLVKRTSKYLLSFERSQLRAFSASSVLSFERSQLLAFSDSKVLNIERSHIWMSAQLAISSTVLSLRFNLGFSTPSNCSKLAWKEVAFWTSAMRMIGSNVANVP